MLSEAVEYLMDVPYMLFFRVGIDGDVVQVLSGSPYFLLLFVFDPLM